MTVGGPITQPDSFPEARWLRVGAGLRQIAKLRDQFSALSYEEKLEENRRVASMPDGELATHLRSLPGEGEAGTPGAAVAQNTTDAGTPAGPAENPQSSGA